MLPPPAARTIRERTAPSAAAEAADRACVYDPSIVSDLQSCVGRPRVLDLLARLRTEIGLRLLAESADRETLAWDAHAVVSASGTLGFLGLSRACAELGFACRSGLDLELPLARTGRAARAAHDAIGRLLAEAV